MSVEIAVMFAGYSRHADELQDAYNERRARQLAQGAEYRSDPVRRKLAVERTRQWRIANRERARALGRAAAKRERELAKTDPAKREALAARSRKRNRKKYEQNPDQVRAWWRDSQRARRDRKRAELGLPPAAPGGRGRPRLEPFDPLAAAHAELKRRLADRRAA